MMNIYNIHQMMSWNKILTPTLLPYHQTKAQRQQEANSQISHMGWICSLMPKFKSAEEIGLKLLLSNTASATQAATLLGVNINCPLWIQESTSVNSQMGKYAMSPMNTIAEHLYFQSDSGGNQYQIFWEIIHH